MSRALLFTAAVVGLGLFAPLGIAAQGKYTHLHHALYEMREAQKDLKGASHNFGGHRDKALGALNAAIIQTEKALVAAGDPYKGFSPGKIYGGYKNNPHLRHCVVELREAQRELREAKINFGGHRDQAIKDLTYAVEQVERCIEHAK